MGIPEQVGRGVIRLHSLRPSVHPSEQAGNDASPPLKTQTVESTSLGGEVHLIGKNPEQRNAELTRRKTG